MAKALAARSWLSDNMGHMLAILGLTTLAGSMSNKDTSSHITGVAAHANSSSSSFSTRLNTPPTLHQWR